MSDTTAPIRVLAFNNFDMKFIYDAWQREDGQIPTQQIWGCPELQAAGFDVTIAKYRKSGLMAKLSKVLPFGDLAVQWRAWRRARDYDVIYCAHHPSALLLGGLRRLGLLKTPVVAVGYQSPLTTGLLARIMARGFVAGFDRLVCMSTAMEDDYARLGVPRARMGQIRWGFDPAYADPQPRDVTPPVQCLAVGKTFRDYATLVDGFPKDGVELTICAAGQPAGLRPDQLARDEIREMRHRLDAEEFSTLFQASHLALIPVDLTHLRSNNAVGLTALLEALTWGLPVVMTRNAYVGIDIEAEGIGLWAEPDDPQSWHRAISALISDPLALAERGRASRRLLEERMNIAAYATDLEVELRGVARR